MKHRKLRIAWSVAWGIVAVLLVALWVRSYRWHDLLIIRIDWPAEVEVALNREVARNDGVHHALRTDNQVSLRRSRWIGSDIYVADGTELWRNARTAQADGESRIPAYRQRRDIGITGVPTWFVTLLAACTLAIAPWSP